MRWFWSHPSSLIPYAPFHTSVVETCPSSSPLSNIHALVLVPHMVFTRRFSTQKRARRQLLVLFYILATVLVLLSQIPPAQSAPPLVSTGTTAATTTIPSPTSSDFNLPSPAPTQVAGSGNQTSPPSSAAAVGCPPPLVPNLLNLVSGSCMGPCCLPCPASSVFYEPNKLENIYTVTCIVRALSATACGILALSYLLLPSRRKHPHLIVLSFATLMVPWEGLGTIWMYRKKDLLCKNVYEIATMSNSWLCGLQGKTKFTENAKSYLQNGININQDIIFLWLSFE